MRKLRIIAVSLLVGFAAFVGYGLATDCPNMAGYHNKAYGCM